MNKNPVVSNDEIGTVLKKIYSLLHLYWNRLFWNSAYFEIEIHVNPEFLYEVNIFFYKPKTNISQINQCKINSNFHWMRSLNKWYRIYMATDILLRVTMHVLHHSTLWQSRIIPSIYEARFDRKIPNESSIYGRIRCSFYMYATYWSMIDDFSILLNYYWRLKIHVYSKRDVTVNI